MAKKEEKAALDVFKSRLSAGDISRLYLFWGEERYLLDHYLREIKKRVALEDESNCAFLSAKNLTPESFSDAVLTCPMFAQRKLVVVSDYEILSPDAKLKSTAEELMSNLPDFICLIFVYGQDKEPCGKKNKTIETAFNETGLTVEFARQSDADLRKWVIRRFSALGKTCYDREADKMVRLSGGLMYAALPEIEKVAAYARGAVISTEDIDAVATPTAETLVYQLTDAVVAREGRRSVEHLSALYAQSVSPMDAYKGIARAIKQLYCARLLLDAGKGAQELFEMCRLKGYRAEIVLKQASRFRAEAVRKCVFACACTESELLSSDPNPGAAVEMLVWRLCSV